ncbi:MAG: Peptide chain release factor 1 [Alphaproteobacteria bacterium MarineAlpha5_Bin9]|nr:MAG: Peptide chain release factor 1 [Alphaproteobacteria bacterium MarineAlpha5_Bin9]|tara:strand:- start:9192 stop:10268 length:1077 start_codon:yes stop_codon:yes gene_type:complete
MKDLNQKIENILQKFKEIEIKLSESSGLNSNTLIKLNKEYADLNPVVDKINLYNKCISNINGINELINDEDNQIKSEAEKELVKEKKNLEIIENELLRLLIPKDINDNKNSILEIRAGTGGEEASLFAANLFNMYQKYSDLKNWKFEIMSLSETGLKGIKEVVCNIKGNNVFSRLKFESGVHRVQRIPVTETGGRIHTSAATVAVLPEAEEVDIVIEEKDLRIDVFRSSGPGGQSVNTTDSAVRITHIPSGIVVSQQDEKSQHKNKSKAMKILRSRILDREIQIKNIERAEKRKSQVGSGDRSERIRTYNFPQGRISDHRINLTIYKLNEVLEGNLDEVIDPLIIDNETKLISELNND